MLISARVLGTRKRPLDDWSIPVPPDLGTDGDGGITLRDLISRIVRAEVDAFAARSRGRRFVRVLSAREIDDGSKRGKVDPGGRPQGAPVDPDAAVGAALQGFVDGLYIVLIDGAEQRDLDRRVFVHSESRLVFLRLTFLAGA